MMRGMNRRTFLQALGIGGAGLVLPSLGVRSARADNLGGARRILFYVTSHGTVYDNWRMRPGGEPEDQDWDVPLSSLAEEQFSRILRPLHAMRDKLLVLDGIANATARTARFNEHFMGHASLLSGMVPIELSGGSVVPEGPSIDQYIAANIENPGPFASLEYAIGGQPVCFNDDGQPLPYEEDPRSAYTRLFPNGPGDAPEPTMAERIQGAQPSVLDFVAQQYADMAPRLGSEDRRKLEQHQDLIRDLEGTLRGLGEISCDAPEEPGRPPEWGVPEWPRWHEDAFFQLMTIALSCGLTRVATLRQDRMFNSTIGAPPGEIHNDFAHQAETDAEAAEIMTRYHEHHAQAFGRLIEALDAIPEEGGTVLDNTVCVWTNEIATGSHSLVDIPVVIAGGGNYFDTGRYVRWRKSDVLDGPYAELDIGPAHNKLLVAFARAMGVEIEAFGSPDVPSAQGGTISTTGMLDRVAL